VHYWADLQSVHGFRCYDNTLKLIALYTGNAYSAERGMSVSTCTHSMAGYSINVSMKQQSLGITSCNNGLHFNYHCINLLQPVLLKTTKVFTKVFSVSNERLPP